MRKIDSGNEKDRRFPRHLPRKSAIPLIFSLFLFALSGCQVLFATAEPFPTDTRTPTITLTRTIQWFPSTVTPTPNVQRTVLAPTADQRPALAEVVLRDNFSEGGAWQTFETAIGTIKVSKGSLTLTVPEGNSNLASLRRGALPEDFYLEITSSTSLCLGKDSYGIAFRSDGGVSQYRLLVSCDGFLRVERWRSSEAAVIQDWTPSGQIPRSGPQVLRLGVWMAGSEMRFFVDNVFQFSTRDPLLAGAQIGVFLRATGANAVTVNFSDLVVRSVQGFVPTPIPSPTPVITIPATRAPTLTPSVK
jgi:hypothetical protein